MPPPGQPHRKLGEVTEFAIDRDGAAVLLSYDLVADRQSKPGALAGRLGREEGLEQLVPVSSGMPMPLSRTRTSTLSLDPRVVIFSAGR